MDYRQIIAESWEYTQNNKRLIRWFGFLPALFTTTVGAGYIIYQFFAFKHSFLFEGDDENVIFDVLKMLWGFFDGHFEWSIPFLVAAIIFAVFYFLYPTLAMAGAIQMIYRNRIGEKAGVGTGFKYGILRFLQLFEYHLLIKTFALFSILIEMSFAVRHLGLVLFKILLPVFVIAILIGLVLTLLFTYADFYIVIEKRSVIEAIKRSVKLVIMNWTQTFLITILMLIIGIRVIVQALLVFLIPLLIVGVSGYLASVALPDVGVVLGSIVGVVLLVVAAYINGTVDIFAYAVWTFTFLAIRDDVEESPPATVD